MKHSFGFSRYIDYHGIKEQIRTSISTIRAKIEVPEKKVIEQPEISHNQLTRYVTLDCEGIG